MTYSIALNFEDGITRFIDCKPGEKVLDAAYRQRINLPMDCSDGVCGTCKCHCESGDYELGEDYIEDALSEDEAQQGQVLTCQMIVTSDCVLRVPVPAASCKTGTSTLKARVASVEALADSAVAIRFELDVAADFLPGQYVNIDVPGSGQTRSYSFSSKPGERFASFLIKQVPGGLMSSWLTRAAVGDSVGMTGPLGGFFLREVKRPLLMLAGGTGLAPFLSMLEVLADQGSDAQVCLVYGVNRDQDLVMIGQLDTLAKRLPGFSYLTCVADPDSQHPRLGYVTQHLTSSALNDGEIDLYLCGPPPMVDAVRQYLREQGVTPTSFHYEKFTANAVTTGAIAAGDLA
ncbi:benzoate 1,2-dioxygenase electron transfer component BenC [Pseudomonas japonica]|uniref:benzoate 1,2-dioxygenase electron transfer component BenC n=1 Tax=Pseudomonas japonica TaxID=256466 RepID=UPI0015E3EFB2|nr:benzoate 1,2-dioxygenase electron transfer component BenC [Pseudomonas japonica]MBA1245425.1 ring-hydroxylating dioxygenase ferredoxin reductase family protein [Pseudomonas japonica]